MSTSEAASPLRPPTRNVERAGCALAYRVSGPEDGRPLVLCHGLAANGMQFAEDAAFFAARGFRVIVPDLRGHGQSIVTGVRHDADFAITSLGADLIAILDAENVEATDWVGNSLGGIIALSLMGTDRARLGRFLSYGTAYRLQVPGALISGMGMVMGSYRFVDRRLLAMIGGWMTSPDPKARAVVSSMLRVLDPDAVMRTARHLAHYDLTANGLDFDGPMLMIKAARDVAVNRALAPTLPQLLTRDNFTLVEMDDAGHCANLEQPARFREIVTGFLGNRAGDA